jgi:hypothetical protein
MPQLNRSTTSTAIPLRNSFTLLTRRLPNPVSKVDEFQVAGGACYKTFQEAYNECLSLRPTAHRNGISLKISWKSGNRRESWRIKTKNTHYSTLTELKLCKMSPEYAAAEDDEIFWVKTDFTVLAKIKPLDGMTDEDFEDYQEYHSKVAIMSDEDFADFGNEQ